MLFNVVKATPEKRMAILPFYTFHQKMMEWEALTFNALGNLCSEYKGGEWDMYELFNAEGNAEGFYMAPNMDESFYIMCPNFYEGRLSADAAGIVACLLSLNSMMWRHKDTEAILERYHDLFFALRAHAIEHEESEKIMSAID